ncbi:MAG: prepilin-type N-terminal cleavage/methylation domain-containing protein [Rhizomicrobium sp.]
MIFRRPSRQNGFALIDVLVALAILAVSLTALFRVIADSAARTRDAEAHRAAELIAQSELAAAGIAYKLNEGPVTGAEGPFAWWMEASPYGGNAESSAGTLWFVTVGVQLRTGGSPLVVLRSLRLAHAS